VSPFYVTGRYVFESKRRNDMLVLQRCYHKVAIFFKKNFQFPKPTWHGIGHGYKPEVILTKVDSADPSFSTQKS